MRAHGYSPLPLNGKAPKIDSWQRLIDATEHEISSWARVRPAETNTGLLTRNNPAFDIDILSSADVADAAAGVIEAELRARGKIINRFGKRPKRAILCRTTEPFKKIKVELDSFFTDPETGEIKYDAIEILGDGQQIVCFGEHPNTKQPYEWADGSPANVPTSDLPLITESDARAIIDKTVATLAGGFGINVRTAATKGRVAAPVAEAKTTDVATAYGAKALASACENIVNAVSNQDDTRNRECYGIGQLVGAGKLPEAEALSALQDAAAKMPDLDPAKPWNRRLLAKRVEDSFAQGRASPRAAAPEGELLEFTFEAASGVVAGDDEMTQEEKQAQWARDAALEFKKLPEETQRAFEDLSRVYVRARLANDGEHPRYTEKVAAELEPKYREAFLKIKFDTVLLPDDKVGAKSQPFPVWALGPMLEGATNALVESAQCQPSLAASSLFGHAAGAVQALVDVRTVRGRLLTTVALIAIAESSEGKSLVWSVAAAPFHEFDKWLEKEHAAIEIDYKVKMVFWKKEYDAAANANAKPEDVKAAIEKLAEIERRKPVKPNFPSVTFPGGGTLEGLINSFRTQVPSSVSSTAEGAQFFRGAAFGDKNAASSASMTIDLIDTGGGGRDLMGDGSPDKGRIRLRDVRFSQITAVQPSVIAPVLGELEQAGQGYHARYLKVAPEPIAHEREFDSLSVTRIDKDPRVLAYNEVMRLMLHSSRFALGSHPLEARGVEPLELTLSKDATILHDQFATEMARLAGPGQRYSALSVTEVAKKTAERAVRFAGVLYAFDAFALPLPQRGARQLLSETELRLFPFEIGVDVMKRAIALARWFLEEERRYYLVLTQVPESVHERAFLDWLRGILSKNDGWKPSEGTVASGPGKGCDGWIFAKDDRKRTPRGTLRPEGKNTTSDRDQSWLSMFSAMESATPPRCYLLGERGQRGLKVLIPRYAVYPE
jgi:Protein of unknown function (DUF3987)/Bifunctional DNA primase/polymerase, N-terminal